MALLTAENYYSPEMNQVYMSASLYSDFLACEAMAMAKLRGEYKPETTKECMIGSYIHAWNEGTLEHFRANTPEMFTKKGEMRAEFQFADQMILTLQNGPFCMFALQGIKEHIMTAEMFGVKWKIKIDSYHPDKCIVDLKTCQSITKHFYHKDIGYVNFLGEWGYYIQGAVYQEVVRLNTGKKLPFYIAAVSKEKVADIEIIQVEQTLLDEALAEVESNTPKILMLKNREIDPIRCGTCDYCKQTKVLTGPIWSSELLGEV